MGEFQIDDVETSFRKESFTATLLDMGIKLIGSDEKAKMRAFLKFDDELPDLTFSITDKNGKSIFFTKEDGKVHTKDFGIGGIIRYCKDVLALKTFINVDPGQESWRTERSLIGAKMTFKAIPPRPIKKEDGTMKEGLYTNFELVNVEWPDTVPSRSVVPEAPKVQDFTKWKEFLTETIPDGEFMDAKTINSKVIQYTKSKGITIKAAGLENRANALVQLTSEGFLEMNDLQEYGRVIA